MAKQHVTNILLAEFDIDQGSTLAHQYPTKITTDNHVLAELMLPDGAHLRTEDWTIFFLNQTKPAPWNGNKALIEDTDEPLVYVLNLVRTKHDASVRRGAQVKAMAICTTHQYLHVYKPVLLLALENYFNNPSIQVLQTLYEAVNSMELSPPILSRNERMILRSSDNKDLFLEKFVAAAAASGAGGGGEEEQNATTTAVNPNKNKDCHFYETKVVYDGIKLPIRVPLSLNAEEVGEFSLIKLVTTFSAPGATVNSHPNHPHLDSNGPTTHPIMLLLNALLTGKRIIFLGNGHPAGDVANFVLAACALGSGSGGVLRGFPERAYPYTNLAGIDHLLTCKEFIAGVTNQIFEDHPSWWDVLCNIDTGKIIVSKDIAPLSAQAPLSNLMSQTMAYDDTRPDPLFSGQRTPEPSSLNNNRNSKDTSDNDFMNDVLQAIQSHYGEMAIRSKFQDYVGRFVQLAAQYEEQAYGKTDIGPNSTNTPESIHFLGTGLVFADEGSRMREISLNSNRIEGWRSTMSYQYYVQDIQKWLATRSIRCMDVRRVMTLLKQGRALAPQSIGDLYRGFLQHIVTDEQIIEFLSCLPESQGGLFSVAIGLFHPRKGVRMDCVEFFNRLNQHPTGRVFIKTLNRFERMTFERLAQEHIHTQQHLTQVANQYTQQQIQEQMIARQQYLLHQQQGGSRKASTADGSSPALGNNNNNGGWGMSYA